MTDEGGDVGCKQLGPALRIERHGALPRPQRTFLIRSQVEQRRAELAEGASGARLIGFGVRAQRFGARFEQRQITVRAARWQRDIDLGQHVGR